jgi:FixJ family two-component response regulator
MLKNKTYVAVVDDDESFARALGRLLRASGFEVQTYPSGEAFLASTAVTPPDCLVLDIQLGGMSGLDLLRQLRALGNLVPIIFVTAHDEAEVSDEAVQAGCVAYLRKPVVSHVLMEALAKALHPSRPMASSPSRNSSTT